MADGMLSPGTMKRFLFVIPALAVLSSCASSSGDFPSLAIRDVERAEGRFEPVPSPQVEVPAITIGDNGSLEERLDALDSAARSSHETFLAKAPIATRIARAGAGAAVASDAWAAAQVAVADLDSIRSNTAIALGDLDVLMVSNAIEGRSLSAIEAVRQDVIAMVADEDATLADLRSRLR